MMTLDNLISVLGLCLTSVALVSSSRIRSRLCARSNSRKKITAQSAKQAVIFYN